MISPPPRDGMKKAFPHNGKAFSHGAVTRPALFGRCRAYACLAAACGVLRALRCAWMPLLFVL